MNECMCCLVDYKALPQDDLLHIPCQNVCVFELFPCESSDICGIFVVLCQQFTKNLSFLLASSGRILPYRKKNSQQNNLNNLLLEMN